MSTFIQSSEQFTLWASDEKEMKEKNENLLELLSWASWVAWKINGDDGKRSMQKKRVNDCTQLDKTIKNDCITLR